MKSKVDSRDCHHWKKFLFIVTCICLQFDKVLSRLLYRSTCMSGDIFYMYIKMTFRWSDTLIFSFVCTLVLGSRFICMRDSYTCSARWKLSFPVVYCNTCIFHIHCTCSWKICQFAFMNFVLRSSHQILMTVHNYYDSLLYIYMYQKYRRDLSSLLLLNC
jgi:hypothetical protein